MAFEAACANCANWAQSTCGIGLAPPQDEPRCDRYAIADGFASQIAGAFLREQTFAVPVAFGPLSKAQRRRQGRARRPPRRGFRS